MSSLETEAGLQQGNGLSEVATPLIVFQYLVQFLGMHNDVETANLSQSEFFLFKACSVNLFPNPRNYKFMQNKNEEKFLLCVSSFPCTLHSCLVFSQVDECSSEPGPVGDAREEQFGCLVKLVVEALLSNLQNIRNVCHGQEVLHVVQSIGPCISIRELGVDLWLTKSLTCHLQIPHEIVMLASSVRNLDHLGKVRRILGLDIRI